MEDSIESLEELFVMERTANLSPNAGDGTDDDEMDEASEGAGLGHALATRTPGPKMSRGDVNPLLFGVGIGAETKERGVRKDRGSIEGESLGFAGIWSGSSAVGLGADGVETVETERCF